ncbi:MAG: alpha/beta hydrolase [bacterium]|nr:alpha/beta hydrolase [bacterium]
MKWKSLSANGVELAYLSAGSECKDDLVIYLHGFPDTARAFEFMLAPTAAAGWHGVSLETRGLPPSALAPNANPRQPGDYSVPTLAADVAEAIAALGYERAVLVGHDWGAVIAAGVAAYFPERVRAIALVGFPHISQVKVTLGALARRPHHLLFQFGALGRWLTARKNFAYIERMYAVWSPSWKVPSEYLERVKSALGAPERLRAALEYYVQIWQKRNDREMLDRLARRVDAPGLIIGGLDEPDFRQRWLENSRDCFTPKAPIEMWESVGHWPHSEAPERFERRLLEFLADL